MNNSKQPINPTILTRNGDGDDDFEAANPYRQTGYERAFSGLTKREHFAGLAMQGILSSLTEKGSHGIGFTISELEYIADSAINMSDALLKQLEK